MIDSYAAYRDYLEADRISLGRTWSLAGFIFDDVWRYQRLLRYVEFLTNCRKRPILRRVASFRLHRLGTRLGFTIPLNVFGPGLAIAHHGTIVVNSGARIGANCRLHVCVNIGTAAGSAEAAPTIGNNCYIGPGAKLYGPITIGDNVAIGANAVVNRSFPDGNVTLAGVPARIISRKGSRGLLVRGTLGQIGHTSQLVSTDPLAHGSRET
jgi:serine O-acetyltransferase